MTYPETSVTVPRARDAAPAPPTLAVVIPTFNRAPDLLLCLQHLAAQTSGDQTFGDRPLGIFEVIVVDDGSTDDTAGLVERFLPDAPFQLRYLRQPNSGPARARNLGIRHVTAPVSVLIGDDIFVAPGFLKAHLQHHRLHPQDSSVALGLTRWSRKGQQITPFMQWLEDDGRIQFSYPQILAGPPPGWQHFYTSNLSFKTSYLLHHPFHEGFPKASMEDIELGYRLARNHNLHMTFLPDAIAEHRHPTDLARACRRALEGGHSEYLFGQLWPEHRHTPPRSRLKRAAFAFLTEPRIVLPTLSRVAAVLPPGELHFQLLLLYSRLGYQQAEQAAQSSKPASIPAEQASL